MTKSELRKARKQAVTAGLPLVGVLALPNAPSRVHIDEGRIVVAKRMKRRERVASRSEQYVQYLECGPGAWDD